MPREETLPAKGSTTATPDLSDVIPRIAHEICWLAPGPAAALRRGPLAGAGAAAFWKLTAEHVPNEVRKNEEGWAALIQAIAILTPKGRDPNKKPAHDRRLPMGTALYKANFSELRLARLLAATSELRRDLAVRACRRLATTGQNRFDLVTLAYFVLFGHDKTDRRIASHYYRADATAKRDSQNKETSANA